MDEYIGMIKIFAGNFAPRGWKFCHGQLLSISGYSSLFSLLGTAYGGDGQTSFALPDLRGRTPIGAGQGNGLSSYKVGDQGGKEKVNLSIDELPAHKHEAKFQVASPLGRNDNTSTETLNHYLADGNVYSDKKNNTMPNDTIHVEQTGKGVAHENRAPYVAMHYIICVEGIYPSRS